MNHYYIYFYSRIYYDPILAPFAHQEYKNYIKIEMAFWKMCVSLEFVLIFLIKHLLSCSFSSLLRIMRMKLPNKTNINFLSLEFLINSLLVYLAYAHSSACQWQRILYTP